MVIRRVRRYLSLPSEERGMIRRAAIELALVDVALRVVPLRRLLESYGTLSTQGPVTADIARAAWAYAYWIDVASRHHVVRAQCLHRSLVLHRWLHGQGAPSVLRIGVRKEGAALKAHAWVELDGEVVYDDTNVGQGFAVLRPATGSTLRYLQQPTRSTVVSCESPSSAFHGN